MQKIFNSVLQSFVKMISDMVSSWAASGLASLLGVSTSGAGGGAGGGAGPTISGVLGAALTKGLFGGGYSETATDLGEEGADFSGGASGGLFSGGLLGALFGGIGKLFGFEHGGIVPSAQGGIVPSAQGGWMVPSMGAGGVLAQLHSNEMVLPSNISSELQNMIGSGGAAGGGHIFQPQHSSLGWAVCDGRRACDRRLDQQGAAQR
jgi:hypothetical protein